MFVIGLMRDVWVVVADGVDGIGVVGWCGAVVDDSALPGRDGGD
jgi:hypothetical protein